MPFGSWTYSALPPSDVAAGDVLGKAVFDAAAATPGFDSDLIAARAELAVVRATGVKMD